MTELSGACDYGRMEGQQLVLQARLKATARRGARLPEACTSVSSRACCCNRREGQHVVPQSRPKLTA